MPWSCLVIWKNAANAIAMALAAIAESRNRRDSRMVACYECGRRAPGERSVAAEMERLILKLLTANASSHAGEIGKEPPEWRVQWLVAGHWRRQYYPALKAHKPRYIAPHVKGPADKPLKPPVSQLFVVKR